MGITTSGTTVTSTESTAEQPSGVVTVSTNQVEPGGVVKGLAAVGSSNNESGCQLKVEPGGPLGSPPSSVCALRKIVRSGPASANGEDHTSTVT